MGYFNYFIKCIIRNITYRLCKPKVLLTILLSILILFFCFKSFGYCSIEVLEVSPNATDGTTTIQFDNTYLNLRSIQEDAQLDFINYMYVSYKEKPQETVNFARNFYNELAGAGSGGLYFYVQKGTSNTGTKYVVNVYNWSSLSFSHIGSYTNGNYTFTNCTYMAGPFWVRYITSDGSFNSIATESRKTVPYPFLCITVPEWKQMFIDFGLINTDFQNDVLTKLDVLISQSQQADNQIANKIEEGNQIQKEQNDFMQQQPNDSDISVDSFDNIDSNDITSSGLTGIFSNIYNSIVNWNSKNISLPVPYTNKSIVIPANYTENMLNSSGATWIITFINSIYYFIVARFMIYSITGIINSIKSGSILETDSKNNITTEML